MLGSCTFSKMIFCKSTLDASIALLNCSACWIHTQFAHPDMQQVVGSVKSSIEISFTTSVWSLPSFCIDKFRCILQNRPLTTNGLDRDIGFICFRFGAKRMLHAVRNTLMFLLVRLIKRKRICSNVKQFYIIVLLCSII